MTAGIFVAIDPRHRKGFLPGRRNVLERLRPDFLEHAGVDPDIGNAHAATMHSPRQQQMRRLAAEERHGLGGADRNAHHRTRRAVDAARQVDGENRRPIGIDRLDHVVRLARHRPVEAGAEQRIDDQCRPADRLGIEGKDRILPAACRGSCVALQAVAFTEQDDRDLAAPRRQFGGRDKAIATIVAGCRRRPGIGPSSTRSIAASATACPALSISAKPGVPAAMVSRSARSISAVLRTSMPNPRSNSLFRRQIPCHV